MEPPRKRRIATALRGAMAASAAGALFLLQASCIAPQGPASRATDAARELNLAARFGRMDLAVGRTSAGARSSFFERRAEWGKNVRVLDVELAGMAMKNHQNALIYVDVAWVRMDEGALRNTRVAQTWRDVDSGWQLVREQRVAGDLGLFGEYVERARPVHRDVQFPSKTIR
jgi:hypothetical protein